MCYRDEDGTIVAVCGKNFDCKNTKKKDTFIAKTNCTKDSTKKNEDKSNRFETGRNAKIMNAHFAIATMERHCMNNVCCVYMYNIHYRG